MQASDPARPAPASGDTGAVTAPRSPLTPGERTLLDGFIARVLAALGEAKIGRIVAFGSRARGGGHADSDLDVAVLIAPGADMARTAAAQRALAEIAEAAQNGWEVLPPLRPVLLDPAYPRNASERALLRTIERDGIVLWWNRTT
ncbi:MAG: hypothetical protein GVY09_10015 [Gammaproteobacteria bacterium]|jgi:predicted nucleotidyltransferase|nr:hypothetical protein [Gammaproteobacteria bacterium]